jgi:L-threonylcarbamoyladenylate synthase
MHTEVISFSESIAAERALGLLNQHQVIVAPTDTVYGLMCRFDDAAAIERIYIAKDRPPRKAIPVLIADTTQLALLTPLPLSSLAKTMCKRFWPGPLTLVLPALPSLLPILTAGQPTIAVRLPDHRLLRAFIRQAGPLAATSANRSGGAETHTAAAALSQLDGRVPLILADDEQDQCPVHQTKPSTIVDVAALDGGGPRLLRDGALAGAVRQLLSSDADRN